MACLIAALDVRAFFDQHINGVRWLAWLPQLIFGYRLDQHNDGIVWPDSLQKLAICYQVYRRTEGVSNQLTLISSWRR